MFEQFSKGWRSLSTDVETGVVNNHASAMRDGLIQKVFGILSLQLLMTVCISGLIIGVSGIRNWMYENNWFLWIVLLAGFAILMVLVCVPDLKNSHPHNLILLFVFTACQGVLVGAVAASYHLNEIVLAAGITLGVTICLTLFALQTKWDFTLFSGALFSFLLVFVFASFFILILPRNKTVSVIFSALGALIFSLYLVYDVQMVAGSGEHSYGPDDYIIAALNVYLDIINVFLYILRLVGSSD